MTTEIYEMRENPNEDVRESEFRMAVEKVLDLAKALLPDYAVVIGMSHAHSDQAIFAANVPPLVAADLMMECAERAILISNGEGPEPLTSH